MQSKTEHLETFASQQAMLIPPTRRYVPEMSVTMSAPPRSYDAMDSTGTAEPLEGGHNKILGQGALQHESPWLVQPQKTHLTSFLAFSHATASPVVSAERL